MSGLADLSDERPLPWWLRRPELRPFTEGLIVGVIVFSAAAIVGGLRPTLFDNYSWLGDALLHGRVNVDGAPAMLSTVPFEGHWYVVEPPLPGMLMIPLCLFAGSAANQTLLAGILLGVGSAMCWLVLRIRGLTLAACVLLELVMLFATAYFFAGKSGDVWQIAEVCTGAFLFLALFELSSRNRAWLVALYGFAAAMSRYPLLPVTVGFACVAWIAYGRRYAIRYAIVLAAGLLVFAAYNDARWGTFLDRGYALYETTVTKQSIPLLGPAYLPKNAYYLLIAPLAQRASFPWLVPQTLGTGMLFTGLVFATAFFAPLTRKTAVLWGASALAIAPSLLYYDPGDFQYYNRHFLDCAPFLTVLLTYVMPTRYAAVTIALGTIDVALGIVWACTFHT